MSKLDLHLHTTFSDGSQTPTEVLEMAHKVGVTALAITDHDIVDGLPEAFEAGERLGIEVIPGVEISTEFNGSELHVLGYYLDRNDSVLLKRMQLLRNSRDTRNPLIVQKLQELGLDITYEEVKAVAGEGSVGRPHIARVLMDKGVVQTSKEAFNKYLADGKAAHVPRDLPSPEEAVRWIREAKGIPVMAHPLWVKASGDAFITLCEELKVAGLGGMEVHYSTHTPQQTKDFLSLAKKLDLLVTGGSDYHGVTKPDIEVGIGKGGLEVPAALLEPLKKAASEN